MESNGMNKRIQVTQETADLLKEAGKEHWLTPREKKVVAKGKGELQTYCKWSRWHECEDVGWRPSLAGRLCQG
jgi:hypothetical protein